ncbi:hypothetical protein ABFS82_02G082500 [Erythranthe guttata]
MALINYSYTMRSDQQMGYTELLEKRQLFLRSYQFSRKLSLGERIKNSFSRVRKVLWARFRSARKLRKILWLNLKNGIFFTTTTTTRRRRRRRLLFLSWIKIAIYMFFFN